MTTIDTAKADLGDVVLNYRSAGTGGAVLLIHGWPYTSHQWREVIPLLVSTHRAIAPDLRGTGDSSTPTDGYDKRTLAEDVLRLTRDVLGVERCHVVAHSWGTSVAYNLAARHPDFVRSVAFLGPPPPRSSFIYGGWNQMFAQVPDLPEALLSGKEAEFFGWFYRLFAHPDHPLPAEDEAEYLRSYARPANLRAALAFYRSIPNDAANHDDLSRTPVTVPALHVRTTPMTEPPGPERAGRDPLIMGFHDVDQTLVWRELVPAIRVAVVDGSGYSIPEHQPARLVEVLRAFFAEAAA